MQGTFKCDCERPIPRFIANRCLEIAHAIALIVIVISNEGKVSCSRKKQKVTDRLRVRRASNHKRISFYYKGSLQVSMYENMSNIILDMMATGLYSVVQNCSGACFAFNSVHMLQTFINNSLNKQILHLS